MNTLTVRHGMPYSSMAPGALAAKGVHGEGLGTARYARLCSQTALASSLRQAYRGRRGLVVSNCIRADFFPFQFNLFLGGCICPTLCPRVAWLSIAVAVSCMKCGSDRQAKPLEPSTATFAEQNRVEFTSSSTRLHLTCRASRSDLLLFQSTT